MKKSDAIIILLIAFAAPFCIYLILDIRPPAIFGIIAVVFILVALPATFALSIYSAHKFQVKLKEMEKEKIEATVKEHHGEKALGRFLVRRRVGSILNYSIIQELLAITPDEVLVEEMRTETPHAWGASVTHADGKFVIPKSEIAEVKLGKLIQVNLRIITREKEYKWWVKGLVPERKGVKLEGYENILRLAFPDKLSHKK